MLAGERALTDGQDEIAHAEQHVDLIILHSDALRRHGLEGSAESRKPIGNFGVMLHVVVAVVVLGQFLHSAVDQNVIDKGAYQRFVVGRLGQIRHLDGAVEHGATTRIRGCGFFLQIVPVLDDLTVLESEDVEADFRAKEVVVGVREHQIAVLKDADRIDFGRSFGELLQ